MLKTYLYKYYFGDKSAHKLQLVKQNLYKLYQVIVEVIDVSSCIIYVLKINRNTAVSEPYE